MLVFRAGHVDSYLVEEGVEKSEYKADYDEYLEGHIPGAVFFSWVYFLKYPIQHPTLVRHELTRPGSSSGRDMKLLS